MRPLSSRYAILAASADTPSQSVQFETLTQRACDLMHLQRATRTPRANYAVNTLVKIRPLADRVLVKKVKAEEKTAGGIVLPESAQENKLNRGTVLAIGSGYRQKDGSITPLSVKVGDQVVLNEFGGTEVKLEGDTYMLYREDDILGVLEEEGAQAAKASSSGKKNKV